MVHEDSQMAFQLWLSSRSLDHENLKILRFGLAHAEACLACRHQCAVELVLGTHGYQDAA